MKATKNNPEVNEFSVRALGDSNYIYIYIFSSSNQQKVWTMKLRGAHS